MPWLGLLAGGHVISLTFTFTPRAQTRSLPIIIGMLIVLAFAAAHALTPSTPAFSRRGVLTGTASCTGMLCRSPAFAATSTRSDECLSCKLKDRIAAGSSPLEVGTDIGALLAAPQFAVKDVIDVGVDPSKFTATMRSTLGKYNPEKARVLVWVQSELVNGVPWCPDTRAALPILESALNRAQGDKPIVLVVADVVRADYYAATYPYRTSQQLQLTGVPTLYRWGRDGPTKRLQERQITPDAVDALLA